MEEKNLLIIHHGALGDVVAIFPAIIRLKNVFRQIGLLSQFKLGKLAQALYIVETFFPLESACFSSLFTDSVDPVAKNMVCSYQKIALFSNSVQLEVAINTMREKPVHRIHPQPEIKKKIHIADHVLSQLVKCGLLEEKDIASNSVTAATQHPDRRNPQYDPLKIVLHPGSGSKKKCWPMDNFTTIASTLQSKGKRTEFIFGPAEHFMADACLNRKDNKSKIHTLDNLTELVSILKTAGGFLGNDSGVSHLAAFLGLPTVVVFGPSDPEIWRPIGRSVRILTPDLDCSPCLGTAQNGCNDLKCFNMITPKMALDVLLQSIVSDPVTN